MVENTDKVKAAANWLVTALQDPKKRIPLRRASTYEDFKTSWYVAALLGALDHAPTDQILMSLWGSSTVKTDCDGSLARLARRHGIKERHWKKLTSTRSRQEAARQVRRIARQLPAAPVRDIVEKLYYWGPPSRRSWAMDWFNIEAGGENDA